jgi:RNA polymerase subunit RPABC4/transcription elongation factor Spt4
MGVRTMEGMKQCPKCLDFYYEKSCPNCRKSKNKSKFENTYADLGLE